MKRSWDLFMDLRELKEGMFQFAFEAKFEEIEFLISSCSDEKERRALINSVDKDSEGEPTILHYAAIHDAVPFIHWILSDWGRRAVGFNCLKWRTLEGETALHWAAKEGKLNAFIAIVEGCREQNGEREDLINEINSDEWTVLHSAYKHFPVIEWILSDEGGRAAGFSSVLRVTKGGETPLHLAVDDGNFQSFLAIVNGCKVENGERAEMLNAVNKDNRTVLFNAIVSANHEAIRWLFSADGGKAAGFKYENLFGLTKSEYSIPRFAAAVGFAACFDALMDACKDDADRVKFFTDVDNMGWNVFHLAVRVCKAEFISHILRKYPEESKLIIDARDMLGKTALHHSVRKPIIFYPFTEAEMEATIRALLGFDPSNSSEEEPKITTTVAADPNVGLSFE